MRNILIAAAAALMLATAARAETADEKKAALNAVIEASIRENVVFLNCSATDPDAHKIMRSNWEDMVASSLGLMASAKIAAEIAASLRERAAYDKMMLRSTPFGEIIPMCQGDWMKRMYEFRFILLHSEVSKIVNR